MIIHSGIYIVYIIYSMIYSGHWAVQKYGRSMGEQTNERGGQTGGTSQTFLPDPPTMMMRMRILISIGNDNDQ